MSQTRKLYTHQRFAFMTLDPVHIGTGGYRLGRVDNTIVREPGTNLPKIPGTSLMVQREAILPCIMESLRLQVNIKS
jgi:CRISPR-associated protein Cmr4